MHDTIPILLGLGMLMLCYELWAEDREWCPLLCLSHILLIVSYSHTAVKEGKEVGCEQLLASNLPGTCICFGELTGESGLSQVDPHRTIPQPHGSILPSNEQ